MNNKYYLKILVTVVFIAWSPNVLAHGPDWAYIIVWAVWLVGLAILVGLTWVLYKYIFKPLYHYIKRKFLKA